MTQLTQNSVSFGEVTSLLKHYGFESEGQSMEELVELWQENYPHQWVRLAAIEALYQGRYKTISVAQILATWKRRGHVRYHFNHEFERLISRKISQNTSSWSANRGKHLPSLLSSSVKATDSYVSISPESSNYVADSTAVSAHTMTTVNTYSDTTLTLENSGDREEYLPDYIEEIATPLVDSEAAFISRSSSNLTNVQGMEELSKRSIDRFTPNADRSDVYFKLMALSGESKD